MPPVDKEGRQVHVRKVGENGGNGGGGKGGGRGRENVWREGERAGPAIMTSRGC